MIQKLESAYAVFALFFLTGAAVTLLTPASQLVAFGNTGSPVVRALSLVVGLGAVALLALHKGAFFNLLSRYWLVLLPLGFAAASLFWAADFSISLRRVVGLMFITMLGVWLAERFTARTIFTFVLVTMLIFCVGSILAVFGKPSLGLHTANNAFNIEHVGSWRGIVAHKNDLGRLAAFSGAIFVIAAFTRQRWRIVYIGAIFLALALIVGSKSGQAVVLFALAPAAVVLLLWMRTLTPQYRALAIVLFVPLSAVFVMISSVLFAAILEALGKDATLSGRTEIWSAVWQALGGHFVFGGGYGSGWEYVRVNVALIIGAAGGLNHAHNGYLDLMADIGIVGVGITLSVYLVALSKVFKAFMTGVNLEFAALGATVLVICLMGNWAASFLLPYDSIFWVLTVTIFCKLSQVRQVQFPQNQPFGFTPSGVGLTRGGGGAVVSLPVRRG